MGTLLSFTPRDPSQNTSRHAGTGSAAIIIFPGVRYERAEQGAVAVNPLPPEEKAGKATY